MEGEKMESHQKEDFEVEVFCPLRILTSPLFEETLRAFLFLPLFLLFLLFSIHFLSFSFFSMLRLLGVLMIFERQNHFFTNFFSNEMVWS
jgi:hypothetical protein